jgi:hypothetical protein
MRCSAHMTLSITMLCHYAKCDVLFIVMLNAIMLSLAMVNAILLSVMVPFKDRLEDQVGILVFSRLLC